MAEIGVEWAGPDGTRASTGTAIALVGMALLGSVALGDLWSMAPVLPRPLTGAAVALVAAAMGATSLRWRAIPPMSAERLLWVAATVVVCSAIVVASWLPFTAAILFGITGTLLALGAVVAGLVLAVRGPRRLERLAAAGLAAAVVVTMSDAPEALTDARIHLLADRYRRIGDDLLADPPEHPGAYDSPTVGPQRGEPEAVLFVWVVGLLGNGAGVVYAPSGDDPSGVQFGAWAAVRCSLRIGHDIWWCGLT